MVIITTFLKVLLWIWAVSISIKTVFDYIKDMKETEQQLEDIERIIDPNFEENRNMWNVFNNNYSIFIRKQNMKKGNLCYKAPVALLEYHS